MNLTLTRQSYNSWGVISELADIGGKIIAVTLEHAFEQPDGSYAPKVPAGTYTCMLGTHHLDHGGPQQLYEVKNVPGHTGILFHKGNYNHDSDGCILLGSSLDKVDQCVVSSEAAFDAFMALQAGAPFTLRVT